VIPEGYDDSVFPTQSEVSGNQGSQLRQQIIFFGGGQELSE
jgi:hypothetical protein